MKLKNPMITGLVGLAAERLGRCWMGSLDFKIVYYDPQCDPGYPTCPRRAIYIFWHEYITFPLYLRMHCNIAMLMSRHADANLLERLAGHFGFTFVRGSTSRGSASALRQMSAKGQDFHLSITPDGPRGPRRQMANGPIYLASKLQMPLVVMGFGYDQPWRLPTWDRFAIPKPMSRARGVISPYIEVPPDLDRDTIEHYRQHVETLLTQLSDDAERWAISGQHRPGQMPAQSGPAGGVMQFIRPEAAPVREG